MGYKNKEDKINYDRKYYLKNKEKIKKVNRQWVLDNPEKKRAISRKYARKINGTTQESYLKSCTYKGRKIELFALEFFPGAKDMNENGFGKPFDILWKGKKIDVKSTELYKRKNKRGKKVKKEQAGWWVFTAGKTKSDYYFCVCLVEGKPIKQYFIPYKHFGKGVCMGRNSKFEKYRIYEKLNQ